MSYIASAAVPAPALRTREAGDHRFVGNGRVGPTLSTQVAGDVRSPVDLVGSDGEPSRDGKTADRAYSRDRLARGGIIALHDTLLTPEKPFGYTLGSIDYFRDHIRHDARFELLCQQDSMSVLKKR